MSPKTDETMEKSKTDASEPEGEKIDKIKSGKKDKDVEEDLSEEDIKLKEELELCVTRLQESDEKVKQMLWLLLC
jgi:hypothetical protein